jgi:hypothetical protein
MRGRHWARLFALAVLTACSVAQLDLSGKHCPCAEGYVCDTAGNVCVSSIGGDASVDQGTTDGGVSNLCDASLSTDPLNCGSCGHDCLGGECHAGACQPLALATTTGARGAIAVDDVNVYLPTPAPTSGVQACVKTGCNGKPTVVATDTGSVTSPGDSVATDGTNVYWSNATDVMQCPITGCSQPIRLATGMNSAFSLVVDATSVYWVEPSTNSGGNVMKCAIGGAGGPNVVYADAFVPGSVAVDATGIYWTDVAGSGTSQGQGQVQTCPLGGCAGAPLVLASNQSYPTQVKTSSNYVFWLTESGNPSVLRCEKSGCASAPTFAATNLPQPTGLLVDEANLYVSVGSGTRAQMGEILVCPVGGCNSMYSVLAADATRAGWLAQDATAIYWLDEAGNLWKVAK